MNFDYKGYNELLNMLKANGYAFTNYHDYSKYDRCVILRHDIDQSPTKAVRMAEIEAAQNIHSTYFVLLTGDFYNVASASSRESLYYIQNLGHDIGLHFDEVAYGSIFPEECIDKILKEKDILSALLGTKITTVSMHRPSKKTLEANLHIPGMINAYGKTFFHDFKYLSDSYRRWREPPEDIICSGIYNRLQIVTHAFWYHDKEETIKETVTNFINEANQERYDQMTRNMTDLESIISKTNLK